MLSLSSCTFLTRVYLTRPRSLLPTACHFPWIATVSMVHRSLWPVPVERHSLAGWHSQQSNWPRNRQQNRATSPLIALCRHGRLPGHRALTDTSFWKSLEAGCVLPDSPYVGTYIRTHTHWTPSLILRHSTVQDWHAHPPGSPLSSVPSVCLGSPSCVKEGTVARVGRSR